MKHFLVIFLGCLLFLSSPELKAGNGSFLITKSAYLYGNPYKKEDKILTRKRAAYEVVGVISLDRSLMFEIIATLKKRPTIGGGYIAESDEDARILISNNIEEVNVYSVAPQSRKDLGAYIKVPFEALSFTGMSKTSPAFPEITWREVSYKVSLPQKRWIPEWAGIYRPDKDAGWFNETYKKLLQSSYSAKLRKKILMGLVETGFTKEQVTLALGQPLRKTPTTDASPDDKQTANKDEAPENKEKVEGPDAENQWIYKNRKIIFKEGRVSRVL